MERKKNSTTIIGRKLNTLPTPAKIPSITRLHQIEDHAERAGISVRFAATKLIEGDTSIAEKLNLSQNELELIEHSVIENQL